MDVIYTGSSMKESCECVFFKCENPTCLSVYVWDVLTEEKSLVLTIQRVDFVRNSMGLVGMKGNIKVFPLYSLLLHRIALYGIDWMSNRYWTDSIIDDSTQSIGEEAMKVSLFWPFLSPHGMGKRTLWRTK